jgi:hypothetical protein
MYLVELEMAYDDPTPEACIDRIIREARSNGHQLEAAIVHQARGHGWPSVVWLSEYKTSLLYLLVTYYDDGGDGPSILVDSIFKTREHHG